MKYAGLFLILTALILSGCASTRTGSELSANQLQQVGEKYVAAGDTASALKYLTQAEKKRPNSAIIQYDLGLAYNQRGLPDEAITHLQNALRIKPSYPEALNALGTVYAERGQVELAQEAFQKALADPFYQTPQLAAYNLGRLYEKKGDPERAFKEYEKAVKFQANYGTAWFRMAGILETMRKGDEARHAYGKAVAGSPDLAEAHLRYGVMSYLAGDMEAALFSLNRVTKLVPNTSMADEARLYLERLRGVVPQTGTHPSASREVSPADIEVISRREIQPKVSMTPVTPVQQPSLGSADSLAITPKQAPGTPAGDFVTAPVATQAPKPTPAPKETIAPKPSPPPNETLASKPGPATTDALPSASGVPQSGTVSIATPAQSPPPASQAAQFNYIVQLGSFVDKEKAEEMRNSLREKGFSPIIKPLKHKVLGRIYVIQLKPESSFSKASTIMTQLGSEAPGEPVILKVPVGQKSGDLQTP